MSERGKKSKNRQSVEGIFFANDSCIGSGNGFPFITLLELVFLCVMCYAMTSCHPSYSESTILD